MARYTGPKNRIARRFGVNIFGRARNPMAHKPNPAGQHGARRKKKSDYGVQLEEQQKLKAVFGMLSQKQLVNTYKKALRMKGNTVHNLIGLLDRRLEVVVYRLRLAPTIFAAQQLVAHGHVLVDGGKVDRRSFIVEPGMTVTLKASMKNNELIKQTRDNTAREIPSYFDASVEFGGKLLSVPELDQVSLPLEINLPMICEFLAHTS